MTFGERVVALRRAVAVVAIAALAFVPPSRADVIISGVTIKSPGSVVAGKPIGDWTANWWQWALAQSVPNDAFTDTTGTNAGVNQSGPVFFVAGTHGGSATRRLTVPGSDYLLIALINDEESQLEDGPLTVPELKARAAGVIAQVDNLHASIDGTPVPDLFSYLEASSVFHFVAAPNNPIAVPPGTSGDAIALGYYLMLAPLGRGTHVINFGGSVSSLGFSFDVTDTIAAVSEPGSLVLLLSGVVALLGLHACSRRRCIA